MELENERLARMFQEEYSNLKLAKKDNIKLHRLNKQLIQMNAVLIASNNSLRERVKALEEDLALFKSDQQMVLNQILREGPEAAGIDPQSGLSKLLTALKEAPEKVMTSRMGYADTSIDKKSKRTGSKLFLEGAKELAINLKKDVGKLRLVRDLDKGKSIIPSERGGGTYDEDKKAWSFCEDNEKQENNFEMKRSTIQQSYVLDGI
jgi:hypothetical protein